MRRLTAGTCSIISESRPVVKHKFAKNAIFCKKKGGGKDPFRLLPLVAATFPKGTALGGGGKVSGSAIRRPLGGAGERSETEGVLGLTAVRPLSQALSGLPALPKGEPRALPEASSLCLIL